MASTTPKAPIISLYDTDIIGIVIFTISLIGVIANSTVAIFTKRLPTMNNPFGQLTSSQATGEVILCAVFCFYYSPMVLFQSSIMEEYSKHAGWINLICYDVCIWSHLFIALNRLCAICFPIRYDTIFSKRNTKIMVTISWVIPIITAIVLYKLNVCDFFYSNQLWAFVFTQNEVCGFISWNIDFYKDISIVIVISIVDIITMYTVHKTRSSNTTSQNQIARRRREVNFLKQAVLQGLVFVVELLTYFIFAWKFENRWAIWSLTSLAWILVHTTDGMIIIVYNREFRALVTRPLRALHSVAAAGSVNERESKGNTVHPSIGSSTNEDRYLDLKV